MRKLTLDVDSLTVESFPTEAYVRPAGTVHGEQATWAEGTCYEQSCTCPATCVRWHASCGSATCNGPDNTCQATCNDVFTCAYNGCGGAETTVGPGWTGWTKCNCAGGGTDAISCSCDCGTTMN